MAQANPAARSERLSKSGASVAILATILLGVPTQAVPIARSYTQEAVNAGKKGLVVASNAITYFVNHLPEGSNLVDLLQIVADHPEFKGVVIHNEKIQLTTKKWSMHKQLADYSPPVEVKLSEGSINLLKMAVLNGGCRQVIPKSNGRLYVDLSKLQELAKNGSSLTT